MCLSEKIQKNLYSNFFYCIRVASLDICEIEGGEEEGREKGECSSCHLYLSLVQ